MADISFPSLTRGAVSVMRFAAVAPAMTFRSPLDGTLQTAGTQGPRWEMSILVRPMVEADAVELQAFLMKLRGQANRALLPYFARPVPRGTINTSGVTVDGALSQGDTQLSLAGCGATKTLLTGDFLKVGDQLVMVVDGPYTSDSDGDMANVKFEYPLRADIAHGASVTLSNPTARYVLKNATAGWETRAPTITDVVGLDFEEAFS